MIEVKNLKFSYGKKLLFDDLSVTLGKGNIYGLLGKNGAGKTTLLKLISGLRFPDSGMCKVNGIISHTRPPGLLERLCFVPEEIWLPDVSVKKYVDLYGSLYPGFSGKNMYEYMEEFGIPVQKSSMKKMSLGQRKKILLSFALASGADLLILDEPTNGLDIPSKSVFRRLLASSVNENQTVIISTHQVRDMENLIDPVLILDGGKIVFNENLYEVGLKLKSVLLKEKPEDDKNIIYYQKVLGGYVTVMKNDGEEESNIDLETLFTCVINEKDKIKAVFGKSKRSKNND